MRWVNPQITRIKYGLLSKINPFPIRMIRGWFYSLSRLVSLRFKAATRRLHSKRPCEILLKSPDLSSSKPFNISLALPVESLSPLPRSAP